jgi:hypothetical protein
MSLAEKDQQVNANNEASRKDYFQKVSQTRLAQLQSHEQMSSALFEDSIIAKQNQASVYANSEGMGGSLVGRLMRDQKATEARNKHNIQQNYSMDVQQKQYEMRGFQTQSTGRMMAAPSMIPTGLEMYDIYNKDKAAQGNT